MLQEKASRQPKNKLRTAEDIYKRIADEEAADTYKNLLNKILKDAEKFTTIEPIAD